MWASIVAKVINVDLNKQANTLNENDKSISLFQIYIINLAEQQIEFILSYLAANFQIHASNWCH